MFAPIALATKIQDSLRNEAITLVDPVAFWQAGLCFMEIAFDLHLQLA